MVVRCNFFIVFEEMILHLSVADNSDIPVANENNNTMTKITMKTMMSLQLTGHRPSVADCDTDSPVSEPISTQLQFAYIYEYSVAAELFCCI